MDIPDQLLKVFVLLAYERFVPVLKKVATALMPEIEVDGMPRQEPPHERRELASGRAEKKMKVIRHQ